MRKMLACALSCILVAGFWLATAGQAQSPEEQKAAKEKAKAEKQERERREKEEKRRQEDAAKQLKREIDELKKRPPQIGIRADQETIMGAFISDFSRDGFNIENQTPNTVMLVKPMSGQRGFWGQVLMGNAYSGPPREYLILTVSRNGEETLTVLQCGAYVQFPFNKRDTYDLTKKQWEVLTGYLQRLKGNSEGARTPISARQTSNSASPLTYKDMGTGKESSSPVPVAPADKGMSTGKELSPPVQVTPATGEKVKFTLESNPSGATITIDGIEVGQTPKTITLTRRKHAVTLSLTGYQTWERDVDVIEGILNLRLDRVQ